MATHLFVFGQSNTLELIQTAHKNYRSNQFKESILKFDSLYQKSPSLFHNSFNVIINKGHEYDTKAIDFIYQYSLSDVPSAAAILPIAQFLTIHDQNKNFTYDEIVLQLQDRFKNQNLGKAIPILDQISNSSNASFYHSLYYTATFLELQQKTNFTTEEQLKWAKALERLNQQTNDSNFSKIKGLKQYLAFVYKYAYYHLGIAPIDSALSVTMTPQEAMDLRFFSPLKDSTLPFPSYFETKKMEIIKLPTSSRASQKKYAATLVQTYPAHENLAWMKSFFSDSVSFSRYWKSNAMIGYPVFKPDSVVTGFIKENTQNNPWVIVDVWGTWCRPCLNELPNWQDLELATNNMKGNPVEFLTLSYRSKDLTVFLDTNNYTFPVLEVKKETIETLNINSFPTTYLISPNGQYVTLPWLGNKEEMIHVYTLLNW